MALPEAAQRLARQFGLSLRQAYRYLEEAAELDEPVEVVEATVPVTLKLPPSTVRALRAYAQKQWPDHRRDRDTRAGRLSGCAQKAWLSGLPGAARFKSISTMRLIDCVSRSWPRPTTSWCRSASALSARE